MIIRWNLWAAGLLLGLGLSAAAAESAADLLARLKAVGEEGKGNAEAGKAWQELVRRGPAVLPEALAAFDGAGPRATNWLRTAVDAIAERAVAAGRPPSAEALEAFVRDTRHAGTGRRLAYEWLVRLDPKAPDRLLPGMLDDPGAELRRDAVERALKEARQTLEKGDKAASVLAFRQVLSHARDRDQVDAVAKELKQLGVTVDLQAQYGFITRWQLVGPFDNTNRTGFDRPDPPEKGVDLSATYEGKNGAKLRWVAFTTEDPYGMVDLNKALGKNMGAAAYAYAVVDYPAEQPVELRAGSNNAVKIFLNGQLVCFRDEYHHGMRMDQHVGAGRLRPGRNEILIKVCQNEQTDAWAQNWSFQLRVCDALGGAVPVQVVTGKRP